jgi:hypothetical protein
VQLDALAIQFLQLPQNWAPQSVYSVPHAVIAHIAQVRPPDELDALDVDAAELDALVDADVDAAEVEAPPVPEATEDPDPLLADVDPEPMPEAVEDLLPPDPRSSPVESRLQANGASASGNASQRKDFSIEAS